MIQSKFQQDLKTGEIGEQKVWEYLLGLSITQMLYDVRTDKFFQRLDIDFIHCDKEGEIRKIEVKTDTMAHRTGNLAYEHTSNKYYNTIGCFEKTRADYMFYYLSEVDEIYIINMNKLRNYVHTNKTRFREVNMGDNALGYLIKIAELKRMNIMSLVKH
jgi:hypothetical protein